MATPLCSIASPYIPRLKRVGFTVIFYNHDTLDACERHDFSMDLAPERMLGKKWQCVNCGGSVDAIEKHWYEEGVRHEKNLKNHV